MRWILVGVVAFALAASPQAAEHTKDSLADVQTAIKTGKAVLVDVREAAEWDDGHLRDAKHLSLSELKSGVPPEKLKGLIPEGKVVYLHCAAGGRCLRAADILKAAGYEARPLRPGYDALLKAGFPAAK